MILHFFRKDWLSGPQGDACQSNCCETLQELKEQYS